MESSAEVFALDQQELQAEILSLQRRVRFLLAIIRLTFLLVRLSGFCPAGGWSGSAACSAARSR